MILGLEEAGVQKTHDGVLCFHDPQALFYSNCRRYCRFGVQTRDRNHNRESDPFPLNFSARTSLASTVSAVHSNISMTKVSLSACVDASPQQAATITHSARSETVGHELLKWRVASFTIKATFGDILVVLKTDPLETSSRLLKYSEE